MRRALVGKYEGFLIAAICVFVALCTFATWRNAGVAWTTGFVALVFVCAGLLNHLRREAHVADKYLMACSFLAVCAGHVLQSRGGTGAMLGDVLGYLAIGLAVSALIVYFRAMPRNVEGADKGGV